MLKKSIIAIAVLAVMAVPTTTWSNGVLGGADVPVMMMVDKLVTLDPTPSEILMYQSGATTWDGSTSVLMTNNFPVTVFAAINPIVPLAGDFTCQLSGSPYSTITQNSFGPGPGGQILTLNVKLENADLTSIPSDPSLQQVATVTITVFDNI